MPTLHHLHLPNLTPYAHVLHLQDLLITRLLRHKAHLSKPTTSPHTPLPPPPPPTILTFTPPPIYTTGRRETTPPSPAQLAALKQPLHTTTHGTQIADFTPSPRGGQITFHGPGQLVVWPVVSLARPYSFAARGRTSLSPRCYVHLLESVTISTLATYGIHGVRTENPGVWVEGGEKKMAALGVHLRRNVTGYGVAVNVQTDLRWFERIVACGLVGKGVSSMVVERGKGGLENGEIKGSIGEWRGRGMSVEEVAEVWVREFARDCGLAEEDVVRVTEEVLAEGDAEMG